MDEALIDMNWIARPCEKMKNEESRQTRNQGNDTFDRDRSQQGNERPKAFVSADQRQALLRTQVPARLSHAVLLPTVPGSMCFIIDLCLRPF